MQTYIPKICSISLLTNRCSNSKIRLYKQMFVTSVRVIIYNTDLQLMIQGGTVMRNESNTITGRTWQMPGNASSRMHFGDVSRNRRIVVRKQKIALVSIAFIALAIILCTLLFGAIRTQAAPSEISCKYYTSIEVQSGDTLWSIASDHITEEYRDMNAYIDEVCSINKISQNEIHAGQYLTIPYYSSIAIAGK